MSGHHHYSSLSKTVSLFAYAVSALVLMLLIPPLAQYVRPDIQAYFSAALAYEIAYWFSWGFVGVLAICSFFGLTVMFQLGVQLFLRRIARRSMF